MSGITNSFSQNLNLLNARPLYNSNQKNTKINTEGVENYDTSTTTETIDFDSESLDLTAELKRYYTSVGFTETDVDRLINNEIAIDDLILEIISDKDTTRIEALHASQVLMGGYGYSSINEIDEEIKKNQKLADAKKNKIIQKLKEDSMLYVSEQLKSGKKWDEVINGKCDFLPYDELHYDFCYTEYSDSEEYKELYNIYTTFENEIRQKYNIAENEEISAEIYNYEISQNSQLFDEYQNKLLEKTDFYLFGRRPYLSEAKVAELHALNVERGDALSNVSTLEKIRNYASAEASFYVKNVLPIAFADGFDENCDQINNYEEFPTNLVPAKRRPDNTYAPGTGRYHSTSSVEQTGIIAALINNDKNVKVNSDTGSVTINEVVIDTDNYFLRDCALCTTVMTDDEKNAFNYIYNVWGAESAKEYLDNMLEIVPSRWAMNKSEIDQEIFSDDPMMSTVVGDIVSSISTPVMKSAENIRGFTSMNLKQFVTNEDINQIDLYSKAENIRAGIKKKIPEGFLQGVFQGAYDVAMGTGDFLILYPTWSYGVGPICSVLYSAGTLGTDAWFSSMRYNLDSGYYSQNEAVTKAYIDMMASVAAYNLGVTKFKNLHSSVIQQTGEAAKGAKSTLKDRAIWTVSAAREQGLFAGSVSLSKSFLQEFSDYVLTNGQEFEERVKEKMNYNMDEDSAILAVAFEVVGNDVKNAAVIMGTNFAFTGGFMGLKQFRELRKAKKSDISKNADKISSSDDKISAFAQGKLGKFKIRNKKWKTVNTADSKWLAMSYMEKMEYLRDAAGKPNYKVSKTAAELEIKEISADDSVSNLDKAA